MADEEISGDFLFWKPKLFLEKRNYHAVRIFSFRPGQNYPHETAKQILNAKVWEMSKKKNHIYIVIPCLQFRLRKRAFGLKTNTFPNEEPPKKKDPYSFSLFFY